MNQNLEIKTKYAFQENVGSTEAQVFFLTNRVIQLSYHLKEHKKDYSSQRGLKKLLGTRKRLLIYLFREDVVRYNRLINFLGIRGLKIT